MIEDDEEQMKEELKEAFRIYDKEVKCQKKEKEKIKSFFPGSGFHHKRRAEGYSARD